MRSVIFLDFDGPIVPFSGIGKKMRPAVASQNAICNLNKLCELTGAQVVVTSDWRVQSTVPKLATCMAKWGFTGSVIDKTPTLEDRPGEIREWLVRGEVDSYVIFDDIPLGMDVFGVRFVQIHPLEALTEADCKLARHLLSWRA